MNLPIIPFLMFLQDLNDFASMHANPPNYRFSSMPPASDNTQKIDKLRVTNNYKVPDLRIISFGDSIEEESSNKDITPWQTGVEWLTGTGPRDRLFKDGDHFTELLKRHEFIEETRQKVIAYLTDENPNKDHFDHKQHYRLSGVQGVGKYIKDYSTLLTGGLIGNLAVTYLGSYELRWEIISLNYMTKKAVIKFTVYNSSTMQSASRPPVIGYYPIWKNTVGKSINNYFETGWGSKTTQTFIWTETLDLGK